MHWFVLAPFYHGGPSDWIPEHISKDEHTFENVPAGYYHDRSRKTSNLSQWLDYFRHARRAAALARRHEGAGYITVFPQLAVAVSIVKLLTFSRRPVLAWCFNLARPYAGWKRTAARAVLRGVSRFVVHSRAEVTSYARWLGIDKERLDFVPLSIRLPAEDGTAPAAAEGEQSLVVALGTANRDYGSLLAALTDSAMRAVIVCGPHAVEGLTVPPNVSVRSNVPLAECHALARSASTNVIPLRDARDASGQVTLLETMAFGKAVIVTRCAGTEDYVEDGVNGILVGAGDVAALRHALDTLWADAGRRRALGLRAAADVRRLNSFAAVAPEMRRILTELAPARPG